MVVVPLGAFLMGEETKREVRIVYPFALGRCTVTFAEWDAALTSGAKLGRPSDRGWGRDRRPVIYVSWSDAQAYVAWLNQELDLKYAVDAYRLPSESEWEYACRAGRATPFNTGATLSKAQAQFDADRTAPVGTYPPNAFGLCDMHGNVWEWCQDVWRDTCDDGPNDGSPFEAARLFSERVLRGGSWNAVLEGVSSSSRNGDVAAARRAWFGFRIARTLKPG
jgi:formylglycine-generating enzyme required for sulfatase activity